MPKESVLHQVPFYGSGYMVAFDFGKKKIGIAIGAQQNRSAFPLKTVRTPTNDGHWRDIDQIISDWQPVGAVVGVPSVLAEDRAQMAKLGRRTAPAAHRLERACKEFAHSLTARFGLPVALVDESYTSFEASTRTGTKHHALLDAVAAQIILETWYDCYVPSFD